MLNFGKYKDVPMEEVPSGYLKWILQNTNHNLGKELAKEELLKRMLLQFEYQDEDSDGFDPYGADNH